MKREKIKQENYEFVVIGGGLAGICAAVSSARHGVKTALIHARSVLGGNASSEIRMHICGADENGHKPHLTEGGILHEILLKNKSKNPYFSYAVWDAVLYETVKAEPNLTVHFNTVMTDCALDGDRISSITCFQSTTEYRIEITGKYFADCTGNGTLGYFAGALYREGSEAKEEFNEPHAPETANNERMGNTILFKALDRGEPVKFTPPPFVKKLTEEQLTYTWQKVYADTFIDCSGDSILAGLVDAEYMVGRESKDEYGEEFGLEKADKKTMGMSIMIQAHETDHKCEFIAPDWAYKFRTDEEMHFKPHDCLNKIGTNFYWIELGGEVDSIHDTEEVRDELLKIAYGVWDHMKNQGDHGAENWELDFIGFLPGKRESRRYVGDYILTQQDVESGKAFEDEVAYGGWQIDNHLPGGFAMSGKDGFHLQKRRLTEPYGIPLRSLYSKNINNLMFAGRNISATHIAFATVRVMATCGIMGQAVGTAAALMTKYKMDARTLCKEKITKLQDTLMEDDCFLPHFKRKISPLCNQNTLSAVWGDASAILNGVERKIWGNDNGYWGMVNRAVTYTFDKKTHINDFRLIVDSDLDREYTEGNPQGLNISATLFRRMDYNYTTYGFPKCMIKSFKIEALNDNGEWETVYETRENHQRMIREKLDLDTTAIRFVPLGTYYSESVDCTYGSAQAHIFAFEVR